MLRRLPRFFFEILEECGLPDGRGELLPRRGGKLSATRWYRIRRRVTSRSPDRAKSGCTSTKCAADQAPGQIWIKRTILEMGGKDAIIVDADADIDAAVEGVAASAFGFQGRSARRVRG